MHAASTTIVATFLLFAILLLVPNTHASVKSRDKHVIVTNNHTNYLSVRCFSFNDEFNVAHLKPGDKYMFQVTKRVVYPSSTMFNCSTNMGTFVAFKYDYECSKEKYSTCDWQFDEDNVYQWDLKNNTWIAHDYAPNYESLTRGGVIKGYYAN